mgnify:CR=1 FL=1
MPISTDLVSHYKCANEFDDIRGTPAGDATLHNALVVSQVGDTKCGSYLDFANGLGIGNTFEIPVISYSPTTQTLFTFAAWVKDPYTGANPTFFLNGSGHSPLALNASGDVAFLQDCFGTKTRLANFNLRNLTNDGQWHRLVVTIFSDPGGSIHEARYYVDGSEVGNANLLTGPCVPLSQGLKWINGGDPSSFNNSPFGQVTDIAVWQRILSAGEISDISAACIEDLLPSANVGNISGTVGTPATFDGSPSVSAAFYKWTFQSVPVGSSITTGSTVNTTPISSFTFTPDIEGLYEIELEVDTGVSKLADATISLPPPPPPPPTPATPPEKLVSSDYSLKYSSGATRQRAKNVGQVPFSVATKSPLSIRKSSDSDFEDS